MDTHFRLRRSWFTRLFGRSPLVRSSDRVEALTLLLAVIVVLVAMPVAGAVGTAVYSSRSAVYDAELRSRHPVTATVLQDSDATMRPYSVTFAARGRWRDHGVVHEDTFAWNRAVTAGEQLTIWVDEHGDYAGPPARPHRAAADGISAGAVLWMTVVTLAAAMVALVRFRLDRRRHAQWDQGLRTLVDEGGGRTSTDR
ncbi:hypothetical protein B1R94_08360 [Mycolicibacterium litorale]|nr:hypothetical protein B1R94_08360 [Mycolicibacterium litorale]